MRKLLVMLIILSSSHSLADCWLGDDEYPAGVIVEGYLCKDDGTWVSLNETKLEPSAAGSKGATAGTDGVKTVRP